MDPFAPGAAGDGGSILPQEYPPALKRFHDGTHRLVAPQETLARLRPLLPAMGITRVANVTGLDVIGIPVAMVCRPNSRSLAVSQGKGLSLIAAKVSGLMESIELYHAERTRTSLLLGSYNELRHHYRLASPRALPLSSATLYHDDFRLLWALGRDLSDGDPTWVPHELTHTDYTLPFPTGSGCFVKSSNGLASGNHVLEAISHGLCESVERDSRSLWDVRTESARSSRRLDLSTVDDAGCRNILDRYAEAGIVVGVWDLTSDLAIPAFLCAIKDQDDNPLHLMYSTSGSGCHPDRGIALFRALSEAAQSRLTLISGGRDDMPRHRYERGLDAEVLRAEHAELAHAGTRSFQDVPTYRGETFNEDVLWLLERLRRAGIESAVVVDLTKPEFAIPVVRVIVPGLEGTNHSPHYLPGERATALRNEGKPA